MKPHDAEVLFSSSKEDWQTPEPLFSAMHAIFNFGLDAAAHQGNHQLPVWLGPGGLYPDAFDTPPWSRFTDKPVWLNPPYGRGVGKWVELAVKQAEAGTTVVMLINARTDTAWFHDYVLQAAKEVFFIRGRLKFVDPATGKERHPSTAPSMVVVFDPDSIHRKCRPSFLPLAKDGRG